MIPDTDALSDAVLSLTLIGDSVSELQEADSGVKQTVIARRTFTMRILSLGVGLFW